MLSCENIDVEKAEQLKSVVLAQTCTLLEQWRLERRNMNATCTGPLEGPPLKPSRAGSFRRFFKEVHNRIAARRDASHRTTQPSNNEWLAIAPRLPDRAALPTSPASR